MTDPSDPTEPAAQPASKTPIEAVVEHAVETFVYAPIGLLFEGASLLPDLVEKGRNQVTMARMIGKFALEQGRGEATKAATKLQDQAAGVLDFIGGSVTPPPADTPRPLHKRRPAGSTASKAPGSARAAARAVAGVTAGASSARAAAAPKESNPSTASAGSAAEAGAAGDLAIPDYDGLSASHVVSRLAGLSNGELEAVRRYEAANRGRKTILSKVAQLQAS